MATFMQVDIGSDNGAVAWRLQAINWINIG